MSQLGMRLNPNTVLGKTQITCFSQILISYKYCIRYFYSEAIKKTSGETLPRRGVT